MRIYLTIKSIPELTDLPANEWRIAWEACKKKTHGHWQVWAVTSIGGIVSLGINFMLFQFYIAHSPFGRLTTYFTGGFVCGMLFVAMVDYSHKVAVASQISPYLKAYFEERRKPAPEASAKIEIDYLEKPFDDDERN